MTNPTTAATASEQGVVSFIRGLKGAAEAPTEMAAQFRELARVAAEEQPVTSDMAERLTTAASLMAAAAEQIEEAHTSGLKQNEADFARAEEPRKGSTAVESKADVTTTVRDGAA